MNITQKGAYQRRVDQLQQVNRDLVKRYVREAYLNPLELDFVNAMAMLEVAWAQLSAVQLRLAPADRIAVRQELDDWD